MTDDLQTPITPVEEPKKRSTTSTVFIIVIVALLLMVCCCVVLGVLAWNFGDQILWELQSTLGY